MRRACIVLLGVVLWIRVSGIAQAGPISSYYITNGDTQRLFIIQGNAVINSWALRDNSYPIAVTSTIKSYGTYAANRGAEYTLSGAFTGTIFNFQGNADEALDGATDAVAHNYLSSFISSRIYQFDLSWRNPVLLFTLPTRPTGITFDQMTGTLWIARDGGFLEEYTTAGAQLHSYSYGFGRLGALAWEPATDTIWGVVNNTSEIRQFSTSGVLLQSAFVSNLGGNVWGGEFALAAPAAAVPEPSTVIVMTAMFIGAAFFARRSRSGALR